ncbi:hypothetical protein [Mesorhizobium japonicum]|uniref:hypothetical protein n=1 Tax=Mesorhizobium japonicum TaxID=2066070 RepID=UPI0012FF3A6F|nr:hypothetical protein [Mesorhizobium japonicum]
MKWFLRPTSLTSMSCHSARIDPALNAFRYPDFFHRRLQYRFRRETKSSKGLRVPEAGAVNETPFQASEGIKPPLAALTGE